MSKIDKLVALAKLDKYARFTVIAETESDDSANLNAILVVGDLVILTNIIAISNTVSVNDAAQRMGVHRNTVLRWIDNLEIAAFKGVHNGKSAWLIPEYEVSKREQPWNGP